MSRKDYQLLADALAATKSRQNDVGEFVSFTKVCASIADALASDNYRFDRYRFLAACGLEGEQS